VGRGRRAAMECPLCLARSSAHVCGPCAREALREHRRDAAQRARESAALVEVAARAARGRAGAAAAARGLARLRAAVAAGEAALAGERERLQRERAAVERRQAVTRERRRRLREAAQRLALLREALLGDEGPCAATALEALGKQAEAVAELLAAARRRLVMQLVELFPLDATAETIAGLRLPGDPRLLLAMNADARGAAVAIAVRVLLIAVSYLSLPLPYRMEFQGSSARIGRWGADEALVGLAGAGLAMESGVIMLRKNVEALCLHQGVPRSFVADSPGLVPALWQLFHSPSLGHSVHRSLVEADQRVARVPAGRPLRFNSDEQMMKAEPGPSGPGLVAGPAAAGATRGRGSGSGSGSGSSSGAGRAATPASLSSSRADKRARQLLRSGSTGSAGSAGSAGSGDAPVSPPRRPPRPSAPARTSSRLDLAASLLSGSSLSVDSGGSGDLGDSLELVPSHGDQWDIIERPQPPKPSKDEDIQHWLSSGAGSTSKGA
jgi:hypothetical protein